MNEKDSTKNESDKFTDYRIDYLFLLIGTNPLPNYVAYRLLSKSSPHVFFVHTSKTDKITDNLIDTLKIPSNKLTKLPVDESNSISIYSQVKKFALGKENVALNYTGGTKVMAVNAYKAILDENPYSIISYLDASSLELVIDVKDSASKRIHVGLAVKPSIDELFSLHGFKKESNKELFQPEICRLLGKKLAVDLRKWCDENLRSCGQLKKKPELKNVILPSNPPFEDLLYYWGKCTTLGELAVEWEEDIVRLAKWFDGYWLENYTLLAFQELANVCEIHDYTLGAIVKRKILQDKRNFEFDVSILKGYQLFAVSCTTEKKKSEVKYKLFEAYVRGHQLGGDEAKIGVVCLASNNDDANPEVIRKEIEEEWHVEDKFRVFGAEDIPKLPALLKEWLSY